MTSFSNLINRLRPGRAGSVRIYDQSCVIPYRRGPGGLEVMMVTTMSSGKWIVPKGLDEEGLTPQESAAQEALEEAGITGRVREECKGVVEYGKWGGTCRLKVFLMEVEEVRGEEEWPESDLREREWVDLDESARRVKLPALRPLIERLPEWIGES